MYSIPRPANTPKWGQLVRVGLCRDNLPQLALASTTPIRDLLPPQSYCHVYVSFAMTNTYCIVYAACRSMVRSPVATRPKWKLPTILGVASS